MKPDVFGVHWNEEDGEVKYRCRGIGEKYDRFFDDFVPNSSFKMTGMDWPWTFFVLESREDHKRLVEEFPGDVIEDID